MKVYVTIVKEEVHEIEVDEKFSKFAEMKNHRRFAQEEAELSEELFEEALNYLDEWGVEGEVAAIYNREGDCLWVE